MAHHVTGDVAGDVRRAFEYYVIGWLTATMDFEIETENYDDDEREKPLVKLAQELKRLVQALCDSTRLARQSFCARLSYLAPLRVYPQRDFSVPEAPANEKMAVGSDAWESLAKNKPLREAVNRWFSDLPKSVTATIASYEFDAEERVSLAAVEQLLGKPAQRKSGKSGKNLSPGDMAELRAQSVPRLIMRDSRSGKTLSPRDVGTGISQVVPILVRAFSANARSINLIEQPELHIHPALQAELGDVFIRSALGEQKNRFILETHSEHLILRLLRRIRQSTENAADYPPDLPRLTPDDVSVIYAQPTKVGTKLIPLSITPDGDFADKWPDGFFTERGRELFT